MSFTEIVMKEYGSRIWFIPDGEVPDPDTVDLYSQEAIVILNPNKEDAKINFAFYSREDDPKSSIDLSKIALYISRYLSI
jgi:hypothetical protein